MSDEQNPRATTDIDRVIGAQIRTRRASAGLSQEALAEAIGLTFQQIQKYEKGVNRVSAATLVRIAEALGVDTAALLPRAGKGAHQTLAEVEVLAALAYPIARLNPAGRRLLVALAQTLASQPTLRA